jgi:hypothetical protein
MQASGLLKPNSSVFIEPISARGREPRQHAVRLTVNFATPGTNFADRTWITDVVRAALAGFQSPTSATIVEIVGKTGNKPVGIEGSIICGALPNSASVDAMRVVLTTAGYNVVVRELRECSDLACSTGAMVDWAQPEVVPSGWYSALICGKHGYKACASCDSVYIMSSTNAAGQAPSVHCDVCGVIMIEWGGTKLWSAELVTRSDRPRS